MTKKKIVGKNLYLKKKKNTVLKDNRRGKVMRQSIGLSQDPTKGTKHLIFITQRIVVVPTFPSSIQRVYADFGVCSTVMA